MSGRTGPRPTAETIQVVGPDSAPLPSSSMIRWRACSRPMPREAEIGLHVHSTVPSRFQFGRFDELVAQGSALDACGPDDVSGMDVLLSPRRVLDGGSTTYTVYSI